LKLKVILLVFFFLGQASYGGDEVFQINDAMRVRVDFWKQVYTLITSEEGYLHDSKDLSIIYQILNVKKGSRRKSNRFVKQEKRKLRNGLLGIVKKKRKNLNELERSLLGVVENKSDSEIIALSRQIRFQRGLADRYLVGLKQSYKYMPYIQEEFTKEGVPLDISYLPHVESSFNYRAYSKVGAAGIFQFMRSTARAYKLKMNYLIDERRDPIKAARAAAKLLKANYRKLKEWPLAIMAYNHGARSIERAVKKVGSRNISEIIEKYEGRRFGFASKNFYATFVATVELSKDPEKYFGAVKKGTVFKYVEFDLPRALSIKHIKKITNLSSAEIQEFNYAIRASIFRSNFLLPRGFSLKLPAGKKFDLTNLKKLAMDLNISDSKLNVAGVHIVSRGQSLYLISKIYRVSLNKLVRLNNISRPSAIFPGMKIQIPSSKTKKKKATKERVVLASKKEVKNNEPIVVEKKKIKVIQIITKKEKQVTPSFFEKGLSKTVNLFVKSNTVQKDIPKLQAGVGAVPQALSEKTAIKTTLLPNENYDFEVKEISPEIYSLRVEANETLGHISDWTGLKISELRQLNTLNKRSLINLGQKIVVKLVSAKSLDKLKIRRAKYHLALEEDFYDSFKVSGVEEYLVKRGDTFDGLTRKFEVPLWLLRRYQKNENLQLAVGQKLVIPTVIDLE
jgi:membrane-bound lytic murein transglycosylase D